MFFVDSSAVVRAYFHDEPDHPELRRLLFESGAHIAASELILLEVTRAFAAAGRSRRLRPKAVNDLLDRLDADLRSHGVIGLIPLDPGPVLRRASELVKDLAIGSLDAIHLAVADVEGRRLAAGDELVFVTRDHDQRIAAEALGFETL